MDEYMKQALEIAKAQAGVRPMTSEQFIAYAKEIAQGLQNAASGIVSAPEDEPAAVNGKASIKERSVTCLVCDKSFKVLGKRHLLSHGLTPAEYREKFGLKKGTPLIAKGLARARREKMKSMKLWERIGKNK